MKRSAKRQKKQEPVKPGLLKSIVWTFKDGRSARLTGKNADRFNEWLRGRLRMEEINRMMTPASERGERPLSGMRYYEPDGAEKKP